jgi:rod shape determining protein RodA
MLIDRRLLQNFDWTILGILFLILAAGLVNMYSAAHGGGASSPVFAQQLTWALIGVIIIVLTVIPDYRIFERLAYPLFAVSILLLVSVFFFGRVSSGARRWLSIGGFGFQPSELVKYTLVLALAKYFQNHWSSQGFNIRGLFIPFALTALPAVLIAKQPDLGTGIITLLIGGSIILFARVRLKSLLILVGSGLAASPVVWHFLKPYQRKRILTFINPDLDPLGAGYHLIQSKIAVGSGRLFGKGFMQGTQSHLQFLPEKHTDFIFSVLSEEWGFVGVFALLFLFFMLIISSLSIAGRAKDRFGAIIGVGVASLFFWHAFINMGMVAGIFPVVGITLPLLSYGGSSLLTSFFGVGLLLNISMRRYMF